MNALYAYFGRMGDHDLNIPSHPLYQIFFLNSISKEFGIKKFDVYYYDKYPNAFLNSYDILDSYRGSLHKKIINHNDISLSDALSGDYDVVFLKYRFRNPSRISSGSFDRLKFDSLYEKYKDRCWIIDTDDEILESYPRILSLFHDVRFQYPGNPKVKQLIPILSDDIFNVLVRPDILFKQYALTFIGNEYSKDDIQNQFREIHQRTQIPINVQGKWNKYPFIQYVIPRHMRTYGYGLWQSSACSIQISKPQYLTYDFMAPRIFESYLLSTIIFSKNSFMGPFSKYSGMIDLCERILTLKDLTSLEYHKLLESEINASYLNLKKENINAFSGNSSKKC
jgi:hypothetical protein